MRHKLLYLLALALTATSSGWGQDVDTLVYSSGGKLCKMILPQTPSNPALESIPSCFANGNPVRVYLNQASGRMIVGLRIPCSLSPASSVSLAVA